MYARFKVQSFEGETKVYNAIHFGDQIKAYNNANHAQPQMVRITLIKSSFPAPNLLVKIDLGV